MDLKAICPTTFIILFYKVEELDRMVTEMASFKKYVLY